jgi:hypothetical protein
VRAKRRELIDALRRQLVPALEQRGYATVDLSDAERRTEIGAAFPFGRLRRRTPNGFDLVEIQLDKYGHPAFRLNVGKVPGDGIQHGLSHIAAEDVWVHYLDHFATLYAGRFLRRWFRMPRDATREDMDSLVARSVTLLSQVDEYLASGRCGRNLRCV